MTLQRTCDPSKPPLLRLAAVVTALGAVSCMGWADIFASQKLLVGGFALQQVESNFYLCQPSGHCGGESDALLDGRVREIGWDEQWLVVRMTGPALDGWRVVDIINHTAKGPFTDEQLRALPQGNQLGRIKLRPVEAVW